MSVFLKRVFDVLSEFTTSLTAFTDVVRARPADPPRLPQKELDRLIELSGRARTAAEQLVQSFRIVELTGVDIVDLQVRVQGEGARLASALKALGERIDRQHFVRDTFSGALIELDERAQLVSAAILPSAVEGLHAVNVKLWEFEPLLWKRYTGTLTAVVQKGKLTSKQEARIQQIADGVRQGFSQVNELLNGLAEGDVVDAEIIRARVAQARRMLDDSLQEARRRMTDAHKMFEGIVDASGKIADQIDTLLSKLRIPVFPQHDQLGVLSDCIDRAVYESVSGVQRFAMLNIASRMQATTVAGRPLLSGAYAIRVTRTFPDRVYFSAARSIIDAVKQDADFAVAPASLHRFNEGSFKQQKFRKGNLQFSYASRADGRVDVDADVDLYRHAVPHLFGEVLVNHLTGNVTDQFAVHKILSGQGAAPIGGFDVLMV